MRNEYEMRETFKTMKKYKTKIVIVIADMAPKHFNSIDTADEITTRLGRFMSDETATHIRYEVQDGIYEIIPKSELKQATIKLNQIS